MYDVSKHRNDFERAFERVKICDLAPINRQPVELWEESICGYFFRSVLYIGDSGKYFASASTALKYLEDERKKRKRKHYSENQYIQYYTE